MNNLCRYSIRAVGEQDRGLVLDLIKILWSGEYVVVQGEIYYPDLLTGFLAWTPESKPVGLITYQIRGQPLS